MVTEIKSIVGAVLAVVVENTVYHREGGVTLGFQSHKSAVKSAVSMHPGGIPFVASPEVRSRYTDAIREAVAKVAF